MPGVHGHAIGHLMKRGYEAAQSHFAASTTPEYVSRLQADAQLYENAGPEMELSPWILLPAVLTGLVALLIVASIDYTLGDVMAALTMIESPTATAIVEDKPPAYYADEPDAPLEKEPLMPAEAQADVEVTLIPNKPITAKITTTMKHLRQVGGFRAKWRGLPRSIIYNLMHSCITNLFSQLLGFGLAGHALTYIFSSVILARFHMVWTHAMIAHPTTVPFYKRMPERKRCKALLLPAFVHAAALQATYIVPLVVAFAVGLPDMKSQHVVEAANHDGCGKMLSIALRFMAVPVTAFFVAFAILLPATVTLTRIEALLLPETEDTIVPFDRQAIVGDLDLAARGSSRKLFVAAWRSFDRASRWRLIKLYVKNICIQLSVLFIAAHLIVAELFIFGGDKLALLVKSGAAQVQLMAIEANQQGL